MKDTDVACRISMINAAAEQEDFCCHVGKAYFSGDYAFFDREGVKWYRWNDKPATCPVDKATLLKFILCDGDIRGNYSENITWKNGNDIIAYRIVED